MHMPYSSCKQPCRGGSPADLVFPYYAVKFAVFHLVNAFATCSGLLDKVLSSWEFLQAVFSAGQGGRMVQALGSIPSSADLTPYLRDALRWMQRSMSDFEAFPHRMENITLRSCPTRSFKYQEAAKRRGDPWMVVREIGKWRGDWPTDVSILKVCLTGSHSIGHPHAWVSR